LLKLFVLNECKTSVIHVDLILLSKEGTLKSEKMVAVVESQIHDFVVHSWPFYLSAIAVVGSRVLNNLVKHPCCAVIECYTS